MPSGVMEQLTYSTVRIECTLANGARSSGTGFFFEFLRDGENFCPAIVSNKHVVAGAVTGHLHFTFKRADGEPDVGSHFRADVRNFESAWIPHPSQDIDLAVLPLAPLLMHLEQITGREFFYVLLDKSLIATAAERHSYSAMEDVVMIGYPNGIWDDVNNLPVIRKGVTATHVKNKWRGRDEFLTDMASFPGSSGSPVMLANIGTFARPEGGAVVGTRIKLLGIHYAGFVHRADGEIIFVPSPTDTRPIPVTGMPNNLGAVIDSSRLLDFDPVLRSRLGAP